ncbi:MAG: hypothetical protein GPJ51_10935 [Candidatus Heimdallarchaeota archaeon]|nr:hypothetical protein [Candidatus Heimdallarchaeota archaeon]
MIPILNYENELIIVQLENRSNEMVGYSETYTPHDSIIIHSNEELLSLGLPGDGSKNNPFIFQNLEIIGSMYGIFVENITYSISILNCNFDQIGYAISLDDMSSSDVEISGNNFTDSNSGIFASYCHLANITNNLFTNCDNGIFSSRNQETIIKNNQVLGFRFRGIRVYGCYAADIRDNKCEKETYGYYPGILIDDIHPSTYVAGNNCSGCSFELQKIRYDIGFENIIVEDNIVNNKPILFLLNISNTQIDTPDYSQIFIYLSENITIKNQNFIEVNMGLSLSECSNMTVENNNFLYNEKRGCQIQNGYNIVLKDNIFENCYIGIYVDETSFCSITSNNISDTYMGAISYISKNDYFNLERNIFENSSFIIGNLYFDAPVGLSINDNIVNGKELGFFFNVSYLSLNAPEYGQLIFVRCNNIIVSSQEISKVYVCIRLVECLNISISDSEFSNSKLGIYLTKTNSTNIVNCNFNELVGSVMFDYSNFNKIKTSTIIGRTGFKSVGEGIYLSYGVYISYSDNCSVSENWIQETNMGIQGHHSEDSLISYNTFTNNLDSGVDLDYCNFFTIHHNNFINNNQGNIQAYDDSPNNQWYDEITTEGNFWSDYSGLGPYEIGGLGNAIDPYPLMIQIPEISRIISISTIVCVIAVTCYLKKKKN